MTRAHLILALLLLLTVVLAACGGSGDGDDPTPATGALGTVTINVDNSMDFKPATIQGVAGEPLDVTMVNSGALEHNFVWDDQADLVFIHTNGGETLSASRTFDSAGTYTFACTIPGHREAGMIGEAVISAP